MRVAFTKNITLVRISREYGHGGTEAVTSATVRGSVSMPSLSLRTNLESVGRSIDFTAQVWRRDFEKAAYTHAEYNGVRYRIDNVSTGISDLIVKLSLTRS